jgi:hypothetical protein
MDLNELVQGIGRVMNRRDHYSRLARFRSQVTDRTARLVRSAGERPLRIGISKPTSPQRQILRVSGVLRKMPRHVGGHLIERASRTQPRVPSPPRSLASSCEPRRSITRSHQT